MFNKMFLYGFLSYVGFYYVWFYNIWFYYVSTLELNFIV